MYRETNRSRQQPYAPFLLFVRLWVVVVEMSFSVRVHPAPFSPTPDRHAGIELKMKSGGPGGSRLGQRSLASSIPREKSTESPFPDQFCTPPRAVAFGGGVCAGWWVEERFGLP